MQTLNFWVDIEDASGNKYGSGPVYAPYFDRGNGLSEVREFSFPVSPADKNFSAIQEKRYAFCRYVDENGAIQLFGGGIIDSIKKIYQNSSVVGIEVSGPNIAAELNYRIVGNLEIGDSTGGDTDGPQQIMAFAPVGWSISGGTTSEDVYIGFDDQTVLNALSSLSEGIAEHWRLGTGRQIVWLGSYSSFVSSGVRAIKTTPSGAAALGKSEIAIIESIEELTDVHSLVTRIYPRGAGNGTAILRFEALTDSPPAGFTVSAANGYVQLDAAVSTYGVIEKPIDFKNISPLSNSTADKQNAANQLLRAAVEYLRRWSTPQKFYSIRLKKVDKLLQPGTTIHVVFNDNVNGVDVLDIDTTLNIVEVTDRITREGMYTVNVQVSTIDQLAKNDDDFILSEIESQRVYKTHAQLNANARWLRTQGSMDDSNDLVVPFWFGNEVVSIRNVILRFKVNPLRSNVNSVAGSSTTTASGGGSTSGSGGATTPTSGNNNVTHTHAINNQGTAIVHNLGVDATGNITAPTFGGDPGTTLNASTAHTHQVSIPNHTHSTPNHQHTLTPNITTTYGIFEETGANTLAQSDITIQINGVTFTGTISSIAGGWYEANITDELVDSAFSPNQSSNTITYTTSVTKTASIITDLSILDIIQAVSIL